MSKPFYPESSGGTEGMQHDDAAHAGEERLRLLLDSLNDCAAVMLDASGIVVTWNAGAEHVHGYRAHEIIGRHFSCLYTANDAAAGRPMQELSVALKGGRFEHETWRLRNDGSQFWAAVALTSLRNSGDEHIGFGMIVRDLSAQKQTDEALHNRAEEWRLFVAQAPVAIAMLDLQLRYVAASERWLQDYGLVGQSLYGRSHYEVFPELPAHWREVHRRCLSGAIERREEDAFTRADGSVQWVRWEIRPWYIAPGAIGGIFIWTEDITARKHVEERLRASEARYRQVVDLSLEAIWIHAAGQIEFANKQAARLFGALRPDDLIGRAIVDFIHPDDRQRALKRTKTLVEQRRPVPMTQLRFLGPAGRVIPLEVQAVPFGDDKSRSVLAVGRDVSERIEAEMALRESEARYRQVVDLSLETIWLYSEGRIVFANKHANSLLAAGRPHGLVGVNPMDLVHPDDRQPAAERLRALERNESMPLRPIRFLDGKGRTITLEIRAVPFKQGERQFILAVGRDVSERIEAEMALRESETRYRQVVDLSMETIWIYSAGRIVFANKHANRLLGGDRPDGLIGMNPLDLVHPDDRPRSTERLQALERNESLPLRPVRFLDDRGRTVTLEIRAVPFEQGERQFVLVVGRDASERIEAERALRESEARFRLLADTMPALLWMSDTAKGCVFVNKRWLEYTGRTFDDELGRGYADNIHADDAESQAELERIMLTEQRAVSTEYRLRGKDGRYRWFLDTSVPRHSADSVFLGHVGVLIDVDARRRLEARMRTVLDSTVDGLISIDQDGTITTFSRPAQKIFGYQEHEVIGRNVSMLMPEPYRSAHDSYIANYLRTGVAKVIGIGREVTGMRKNGQVFPMDLAIGELPGEVGRREFVGTVRDISERRQLEEQLRQAQKMETVGQLTGGIAHDFNNLLTVIIGHLDLVAGHAAADVAAGIGTALQAADRGAALVGRLLAFSRRQMLIPQALDLNQVASGMTALLRSALGEHINIKLALTPDLWTAFADRGQIENAIVNLAINARDAMPDGGTLTIETGNHHLDDDYAARTPDVKVGDYVTLAVSDTGTGMPPDVRNHAFEPFFTTKEVGKGSGLGLSMVYGFAKQSDGHARIYSEVGHGTTVRLYLPRHRAAGGPADLSAATPVDGPRGGETILVVEDDAGVRTFSVTLLRELGYRVLEAGDAQQALQILESDAAIDLLFTDVVMPGGLTGRQLVDKAAHRRPGLKTLFTSGYTENSIVHHGRLEPGTHFLPKPYRRLDLARKVREILDKVPPATPSEHTKGGKP